MVDLFDLTFANEESGQNFEVSVSDLFEQPGNFLEIEVKPLNDFYLREDLLGSEWVPQDANDVKDIFLIEHCQQNAIRKRINKITNSPYYLIQAKKISKTHPVKPFNFVKCRIATTSEGKLIFKKISEGQGGMSKIADEKDRGYWEWMTYGDIWWVKSLSNEKQTFINWKESPFDQK